jgi:hypothetical protein
MDHFAGLDVSVKQTSICILDDTGRMVREVKVASEPEALVKILVNPAYRFKRIGLEADIAQCGRHVRATNRRHRACGELWRNNHTRMKSRG